MRSRKAFFYLVVTVSLIIIPFNFVSRSSGQKPTQLKNQIELPTNEVAYLELSPDGERILAGPAVPAGRTVVILHKAIDGEVLDKFPAKTYLKSIDLSPDGTYVASTGNDRLKVWNIRDDDMVFTSEPLTLVPPVSFSPNSDKLAFGYCIKEEEGKCSKSEVRTVDLNNDRVTTLTEPTERRIYSIKWGNNGLLACSFGGFSSANNSIKFYDVESGKLKGKVQSKYGPTSFFGRGFSEEPEMVFGEEGRLFASTSIGGWNGRVGSQTVIVWKMASGKVISNIKLTNKITSIDFCANSNLLATATPEGTVSFWNIENETKVHSFKAHEESVNAIDCSANGKILATGSGDNTVKIWDVNIDPSSKEKQQAGDDQRVDAGTDVTNEISEVSQEDFPYYNATLTIPFDSDERLERFAVLNEDDSSIVKIYPINDGRVPHSMIIDRFDSSSPFEKIVPNIDINSVSVRQIGGNFVKFKMNLRKSPLLLSDEVQKKLTDENKVLEYIWKIDTDVNSRTEKSSEDKSSEYQITLKGDGENWEATFEDKINDITSPVNDYEIKGNQIEATISLKELGNPSLIHYSALTRSPKNEVASVFVDKSSPPLNHEINFFDGRTTPPDNSRPGTLKVRRDYMGDGNEEITKIYRLPILIEEIETTDEIPTTITAITKNSEYLFDYFEGEIRIREKS